MAVEHYRQYIRQVLSERAKRASSQYNTQEYEVQTVFDTKQDIVNYCMSLERK